MKRLIKDIPTGFRFGEMLVSRICYDDTHGALLCVASKKQFVEIRVSQDGNVLEISKKFKRNTDGNAYR